MKEKTLLKHIIEVNSMENENDQNRKIIKKSYYDQWSEGAEKLTDFVSIDGDDLVLGEEDNVKIRKEEIKLDTTYRTFSEAMDCLCQFLDGFKRTWSDIIEDIEDLQIQDTSSEEDIEDLIKKKKEMIHLAKEVLEWGEDLTEDGLKLDGRDNIPYDELRVLISRLTEGKPRKPIEVRIKI